MMNQGLLAEAKELFLYKELNALQTVGYRELFSFFEDEFTLEFAIEEIKKNTRRFSKRQLTWFKKNEETKWFDYLTDKNEIIELKEYFDSFFKTTNRIKAKDRSDKKEEEKKEVVGVVIKFSDKD